MVAGKRFSCHKGECLAMDNREGCIEDIPLYRCLDGIARIVARCFAGDECSMIINADFIAEPAPISMPLLLTRRFTIVH